MDTAASEEVTVATIVPPAVASSNATAITTTTETATTPTTTTVIQATNAINVNQSNSNSQTTHSSVSGNSSNSSSNSSSGSSSAVSTITATNTITNNNGSSGSNISNNISNSNSSNSNSSSSSSSTSSNSSGYGSTTTTPTNNYETHQQQSSTPTPIRTPTTPVAVAVAEPIIPIATVAAVTPYYNESITTHNLEIQHHHQQQQQQHQQQQHQQLQQQHHQQQHQQQQHQLQQNLQHQHNQYLQRQYYSPYDYQQQTTNFSTSSAAAAAAYNMNPAIPYDISSTNLSTGSAVASSPYVGSSQYKSSSLSAINYERNTIAGRSTATASYHQQTQPQQQVQSEHSSKSLQNLQQLQHQQLPHQQQQFATKRSSSSLITSSSATANTNKPQAAATAFYAQPLSQQHTNPSATYYDKHKMSLDYHDTYNNPTTATYHHPHHQQQQQHKYYAAAKSQLKEAYGSPGIASKTLYGNTTNLYTGSTGTPGSYGYDKYMYPHSAATAYTSAAGHLGNQEVPPDTGYRKTSAVANTLNSPSWPWGIDYATGSSRTIPPPPPPTTHLPTATVAPTHATYLTPHQPSGLTRDPYYMAHDKYTAKYDKYSAAAMPPAYQQSYVTPTTRHHMWPSSHVSQLTPLNDRHHLATGPSGPQPPPPSHTHALHSSAYFPGNTATALNARQACCPQPYQPQNCYYPPANRPPPAIGQSAAAASPYMTATQQPLNPALTASCKYGGTMSEYGNGNKLKNPNDLYLTSHYDTTNTSPHGYGYATNQLYNPNAHQPQLNHATPTAAASLLTHDPSLPHNPAAYTNDLNLSTNTYDNYPAAAYHHDSSHLGGMHGQQPPLQPAPPPQYAPTVAKRALLEYRKPIQPQPPPLTQDECYTTLTTATAREPYTHQDLLNTPETTTSFTEYDANQEIASLNYNQTSTDGLQETDKVSEEVSKNLSLRDFIANWNDDEDEFAANNTEELSFEDSSVINEVLQQAATTPQVVETVSADMAPIKTLEVLTTGEQTPLLDTAANAKSKEKLSADNLSELEANQYVNLPDIIIDIEKSNNVNNSITTPSTTPTPQTEEKIKEGEGNVADPSKDPSLNLTNFDVEKELDELNLKKDHEKLEITKDINDIKSPTNVTMPQLSPCKGLATQLSFEDLNLETGNSKTVLTTATTRPLNNQQQQSSGDGAAADVAATNDLPIATTNEQYFKDIDGYDSGNSRHSNESAFEKEYETFINKITSESTASKTTKSDNSVVNNTDTDIDFEQHVQDFSKFYKRKRKLKEDELKSLTVNIQNKKKLKSNSMDIQNGSNFPQVYTKKSRNRLGKWKVKTQDSHHPKRKPLSAYYKKIHSLRHFRLFRLKRVREFMSELKEKHLPLIKRQSIKNYSHAIEDNLYNPKSLKSLSIIAINTEEFRQLIMLSYVETATENSSESEEKHICTDPSCETCEVIKSLMEPESYESTLPNTDQEEIYEVRGDIIDTVSLLPAVILANADQIIIANEDDDTKVIQCSLKDSQTEIVLEKNFETCDKNEIVGDLSNTPLLKVLVSNNIGLVEATNLNLAEISNNEQIPESLDKNEMIDGNTSSTATELIETNVEEQEKIVDDVNIVPLLNVSLSNTTTELAKTNLEVSAEEDLCDNSCLNEQIPQRLESQSQPEDTFNSENEKSNTPENQSSFLKENLPQAEANTKTNSSDLEKQAQLTDISKLKSSEPKKLVNETTEIINNESELVKDIEQENIVPKSSELMENTENILDLAKSNEEETNKSTKEVVETIVNSPSNIDSESSSSDSDSSDSDSSESEEEEELLNESQNNEKKNYAHDEKPATDKLPIIKTDQNKENISTTDESTKTIASQHQESLESVNSDSKISDTKSPNDVPKPDISTEVKCIKDSSDIQTTKSVINLVDSDSEWSESDSDSSSSSSSSSSSDSEDSDAKKSIKKSADKDSSSDSSDSDSESEEEESKTTTDVKVKPIAKTIKEVIFEFESETNKILESLKQTECVSESKPHQIEKELIARDINKESQLGTITNSFDIDNDSTSESEDENMELGNKLNAQDLNEKSECSTKQCATQIDSLLKSEAVDENMKNSLESDHNKVPENIGKSPNTDSDSDSELEEEDIKAVTKNATLSSNENTKHSQNLNEEPENRLKSLSDSDSESELEDEKTETISENQAGNVKTIAKNSTQPLNENVKENNSQNLIEQPANLRQTPSDIDSDSESESEEENTKKITKVLTRSFNKNIKEKDSKKQIEEPENKTTETITKTRTRSFNKNIKEKDPKKQIEEPESLDGDSKKESVDKTTDSESESEEENAKKITKILTRPFNKNIKETDSKKQIVEPESLDGDSKKESENKTTETITKILTRSFNKNIKEKDSKNRIEEPSSPAVCTSGNDRDSKSELEEKNTKTISKITTRSSNENSNEKHSPNLIEKSDSLPKSLSNINSNSESKSETKNTKTIPKIVTRSLNKNMKHRNSPTQMKERANLKKPHSVNDIVSETVSEAKKPKTVPKIATRSSTKNITGKDTPILIMQPLSYIDSDSQSASPKTNIKIILDKNKLQKKENLTKKSVNFVQTSINIAADSKSFENEKPPTSNKMSKEPAITNKSVDSDIDSESLSRDSSQKSQSEALEKIPIPKLKIKLNTIPKYQVSKISETDTDVTSSSSEFESEVEEDKDFEIECNKSWEQDSAEDVDDTSQILRASQTLLQNTLLQEATDISQITQSVSLDFWRPVEEPKKIVVKISKESLDKKEKPESKPNSSLKKKKKMVKKSVKETSKNVKSLQKSTVVAQEPVVSNEPILISDEEILDKTEQKANEKVMEVLKQWEESINDQSKESKVNVTEESLNQHEIEQMSEVENSSESHTSEKHCSESNKEVPEILKVSVDNNKDQSEGDQQILSLEILDKNEVQNSSDDLDFTETNENNTKVSTKSIETTYQISDQAQDDLSADSLEKNEIQQLSEGENSNDEILHNSEHEKSDKLFTETNEETKAVLEEMNQETKSERSIQDLSSDSLAENETEDNQAERSQQCLSADSLVENEREDNKSEQSQQDLSSEVLADNEIQQLSEEENSNNENMNISEYEKSEKHLRENNEIEEINQDTKNHLEQPLQDLSTDSLAENEIEENPSERSQQDLSADSLAENEIKKNSSERSQQDLSADSLDISEHEQSVKLPQENSETTTALLEETNEEANSHSELSAENETKEKSEVEKSSDEILDIYEHEKCKNYTEISAEEKEGAIVLLSLQDSLAEKEIEEMSKGNNSNDQILDENSVEHLSETKEKVTGSLEEPEDEFSSYAQRSQPNSSAIDVTENEIEQTSDEILDNPYQDELFKESTEETIDQLEISQKGLMVDHEIQQLSEVENSNEIPEYTEDKAEELKQATVDTENDCSFNDDLDDTEEDNDKLYTETINPVILRFGDDFNNSKASTANIETLKEDVENDMDITDVSCSSAESTQEEINKNSPDLSKMDNLFNENEEKDIAERDLMDVNSSIPEEINNSTDLTNLEENQNILNQKESRSETEEVLINEDSNSSSTSKVDLSKLNETNSADLEDLEENQDILNLNEDLLNEGSSSSSVLEELKPNEKSENVSEEFTETESNKMSPATEESQPVDILEEKLDSPLPATSNLCLNDEDADTETIAETINPVILNFPDNFKCVKATKDIERSVEDTELNKKQNIEEMKDLSSSEDSCSSVNSIQASNKIVNISEDSCSSAQSIQNDCEPKEKNENIEESDVINVKYTTDNMDISENAYFSEESIQDHCQPREQDTHNVMKDSENSCSSVSSIEDSGLTTLTKQTTSNFENISANMDISEESCSSEDSKHDDCQVKVIAESSNEEQFANEPPISNQSNPNPMEYPQMETSENNKTNCVSPKIATGEIIPNSPDSVDNSEDENKEGGSDPQNLKNLESESSEIVESPIVDTEDESSDNITESSGKYEINSVVHWKKNLEWKNTSKNAVENSELAVESNNDCQNTEIQRNSDEFTVEYHDLDEASGVLEDSCKESNITGSEPTDDEPKNDETISESTIRETEIIETDLNSAKTTEETVPERTNEEIDINNTISETTANDSDLNVPKDIEEGVMEESITNSPAYVPENLEKLKSVSKTSNEDLTSEAMNEESEPESESESIVDAPNEKTISYELMEEAVPTETKEDEISKSKNEELEINTTVSEPSNMDESKENTNSEDDLDEDIRTNIEPKDNPTPELTKVEHESTNIESDNSSETKVLVAFEETISEEMSNESIPNETETKDEILEAKPDEETPFEELMEKSETTDEITGNSSVENEAVLNQTITKSESNDGNAETMIEEHFEEAIPEAVVDEPYKEAVTEIITDDFISDEVMSESTTGEPKFSSNQTINKSELNEDNADSMDEETSEETIPEATLYETNEETIPETTTDEPRNYKSISESTIGESQVNENQNEDVLSCSDIDDRIPKTTEIVSDDESVSECCAKDSKQNNTDLEQITGKSENNNSALEPTAENITSEVLVEDPETEIFETQDDEYDLNESVLEATEDQIPETTHEESEPIETIPESTEDFIPEKSKQKDIFSESSTEDQISKTLDKESEINETNSESITEEQISSILVEESDLHTSALEATNEDEIYETINKESELRETCLESTTEDEISETTNKESEVRETCLESTGVDYISETLAGEVDQNKAASPAITENQKSQLNEIDLESKIEEPISETMHKEPDLNETLSESTEKDTVSANQDKEYETVSELLNENIISETSNILESETENLTSENLYQKEELKETICESSEEQTPHKEFEENETTTEDQDSKTPINEANSVSEIDEYVPIPEDLITKESEETKANSEITNEAACVETITEDLDSKSPINETEPKDTNSLAKIYETELHVPIPEDLITEESEETNSEITKEDSDACAETITEDLNSKTPINEAELNDNNSVSKIDETQLHVTIQEELITEESEETKTNSEIIEENSDACSETITEDLNSKTPINEAELADTNSVPKIDETQLHVPIPKDLISEESKESKTNSEITNEDSDACAETITEDLNSKTPINEAELNDNNSVSKIAETQLHVPIPEELINEESEEAKPNSEITNEDSHASAQTITEDLNSRTPINEAELNDNNSVPNIDETQLHVPIPEELITEESEETKTNSEITNEDSETSAELRMPKNLVTAFKESQNNTEDLSGDFYGFKNQSSFEDESGDFHGFEDIEEARRIRQEIENLNDDSAANDGFLQQSTLNKEQHTSSTSSLAGSTTSEINELEALEKEISQHQEEKQLGKDAVNDNEDNDKETDTVSVAQTNNIISTNDIEHIKKMLESDEEQQHDDVEDHHRDEQKSITTKDAKETITTTTTSELSKLHRDNSIDCNDEQQHIIKSVNSIIPKLSDLCRAALNSSLNSNNNLPNVQIVQDQTDDNDTATIFVERELSVEEALAEMYRQAGVLLSDPEDNDNDNAGNEEAQDVLLINLQEILNSDNNDVYVLQCDMNENILNVVQQTSAGTTNNTTDENNDPSVENTERVNTTVQFIGIVQNTNDNETQIHIISSDSESDVIILSDDCESDFETYNGICRSQERVIIPFINDMDFAAPTTITTNNTCVDDDSLSDISTIHHEEIVPDNLNKFLQEEFYKYLHEKYVQRNISKYYHANRVLKKYKKRFIKRKY